MPVAAPSARISTRLRVAFLTNSLSPHSLPLWETMSRGVQHFRAFVSAEYDFQHKFPKVRTDLDVRLQRSFNRLRFYSRPYGSWSRTISIFPTTLTRNWRRTGRTSSFQASLACVLPCQFSIASDIPG